VIRVNCMHYIRLVLPSWHCTAPGCRSLNSCRSFSDYDGSGLAVLKDLWRLSIVKV
jgi:hypothetical protein